MLTSPSTVDQAGIAQARLARYQLLQLQAQVELDAIRRELDVFRDKCVGEIYNLHKEQDSLKTYVDSLHDKLSQADERVAAAESRAVAAKKEKEAANSEITALRRAVESARSESVKLVADLRVRDEQLMSLDARLKAQCESHTAEVAKYEERLALMSTGEGLDFETLITSPHLAETYDIRLLSLGFLVRTPLFTCLTSV